MSTKIMRRPWKVNGVSIESRVVPATSDTTRRSSPSSLLMKSDLPTFGRPMTATRRSSPVTSSCSGGRIFTSSSSRSPEFLPFCAETGCGSPGAELVELVEVRALGIVHLVGDHEPWLAGLAHQLGDARVARMHADLRVDDEQHHVGLFDGLRNLFADLDVHRNGRVLAEAAGVHEPERAAVPLGACIVTVARRAGLVAHDRGVAADDRG